MAAGAVGGPPGTRLVSRFQNKTACDVIINNYHYLVQHVDEIRILPHLVSSGLFGPDFHQRLDGKLTDREKMMPLLQHLTRSTEETWLDRFTNALSKFPQYKIVVDKLLEDFAQTLKERSTHPSVEDDDADVRNILDEATSVVIVSGVDKVLKKAMEDAQVAMKEAQEDHKTALSELKKANEHVLEAEKGRIVAEAQNRLFEERMQEADKRLSVTEDKLRWSEFHKQLLEEEVQSCKEDCREIQQKMDTENKQLSSRLDELRLLEEAGRKRVQEVEGERVVLESRVADLQAAVERCRREKEEEVTLHEQQLDDARKQQQTLKEMMRERQKRFDQLQSKQEEELICLKKELEKTNSERVFNEEDVQQAERQPPLASQPMVSYDVIEPRNQSISVIACPVPGAEETVSQWKLRSDGKLDLPRPVPGADYFLKVRYSDGNSVRIPIGGAVCTPVEVPPPPAVMQSPSEVAQSLPPVVQSTLVVLQPPPKEVQPEQSPWPIEAESPTTANSILPNTAVEQIGDSSPYKPNHVRNLSFPPPDSSPSSSKNPLPSHSTPSDRSRHSSNPLSPASPSTPKLYLTEGPDQTPRAAEISWSVDAMKKTTGVISVKRGTTYRLEVPPQRETLILKIKTFGKRRLTDPLPSDIDEALPVTVRHLNEFSTRLAPYWDRIGHGIGVKIVPQLRDRHDDSRKMTLVFESWVEDAPKWEDLLLVLENTLQLTAISSNIRDYLREEYSNVIGGGRQGASPFDSD